MNSDSKKAKINFRPFGNFEDNKNIKILILGESHYCETQEDAIPELTKAIFDRYFNYKNGDENSQYEHWMNTYTKFTNVFLEEKATTEQVLEFWNSVVFYNYVQTHIDGARISPTAQQFKESEEAFIEVLNEFKPDLIIVWGNRLWDNLASSEKTLHNILDKEAELIIYKVDGKEIPAYNIYHPSTWRFNYSESEYLKELVKIFQPVDNGAF